jgi:hypothetical protein
VNRVNSYLIEYLKVCDCNNPSPLPGRVEDKLAVYKGVVNAWHTVLVDLVFVSCRSLRRMFSTASGTIVVSLIPYPIPISIHAL